MSESAENLKTLDYAQHPTVGNLLVQRRDDGVTVTIMPDARRVLEVLPAPLSCLIFAGVFYLLRHVAVGPRSLGSYELLAPAIFVAIGIATAVWNLNWLLHPWRWDADEKGLTFTGRRAL